MDRNQKRELNKILRQNSSTLAGVLLYLYGLIQVLFGGFILVTSMISSDSDQLTTLYLFLPTEQSIQFMSIIVAAMLVFSGLVSMSLGGILNKSRQSHYYLKLLVEKDFKEGIRY